MREAHRRQRKDFMLHDILKNLSSTDITLLGSLMGIFGIIVGGASSLVNLLISKRYEDKRHFRSFLVPAKFHFAPIRMV